MSLAGSVAAVSRLAAAQAKTPITVYKTPTCSCCHDWVTHMAANGFATTVKDLTDLTQIKQSNHVPNRLTSCHTAVVGGYVIEGHVPAADVKRLLTEKPKGVVGLAIPGMPQSAPGMDLKPFVPYTVLAFDAQGKTTEYAKHLKG